MSKPSALLKRLMIAGALVLGSCETPSPALTAGPVHTELPSLSKAMNIEAASRGRAMAIIGCASCHAIDATGNSPFAPAPPFRDIVRRRSLDDLETTMAQGLVTTHPAMPAYVFRASEIDDLIAYLGTLKTPTAGSSRSDHPPA